MIQYIANTGRIVSCFQRLGGGIDIVGEYTQEEIIETIQYLVYFGWIVL